MTRPSNSNVGAVPAELISLYHCGLLVRSIRTMVTFLTPFIFKARLALCVNGQSPSPLLSGEAYNGETGRSGNNKKVLKPPLAGINDACRYAAGQL